MTMQRSRWVRVYFGGRLDRICEGLDVRSEGEEYWDL